MRGALRWLLIIGLLVGTIWGLTAVPIRGRTAFGHSRTWWKKTDPVTVVRSFIVARYEAWFGDTPSKPSKPKAKSKSKTAVKKTPPRRPEEAATARRVAVLEAATRVMEQKSEVRAAPARTRVDERLSNAQKKALDELVTSRITRR